MKSRKWIILLFALNFGIGITVYSQWVYPPSKKTDFDTLIYSRKISDEYAWMSMAENDSAIREYAL